MRIDAYDIINEHQMIQIKHISVCLFVYFVLTFPSIRNQIRRKKHTVSWDTTDNSQIKN